MNNFVTSLTRTYVPIIVGAIASYLLSKGIELDAQAQLGLITFTTALLQSVYYLVARLLERRNPQLGLLLGSTAQPKYVEQSYEGVKG